MKDDFLSSSGAWRRDVLLGARVATVAVGLAPACARAGGAGQTLPLPAQAKEQRP